MRLFKLNAPAPLKCDVACNKIPPTFDTLLHEEEGSKAKVVR